MAQEGRGTLPLAPKPVGPVFLPICPITSPVDPGNPVIRYEVTSVKDWEKEISPRLTLLRQPNEKRNDSATIDQSDMRGLGTA